MNVLLIMFFALININYDNVCNNNNNNNNY
jgi:hypothetical protein